MSTEPNVNTGARIVGYCRACGKALDEATMRQAHGTLYCEEHAPAATQAYPPPPPPYTPPPDSPYAASAPPPVPRADVSPGVAFVLGLIPGVGAIYNGQYAKGFVHVLVLGMLIAIIDRADRFQAMLGLMIAGFFFYMAFEAYHTARKRRLGEPVDEFSSLVPSRSGSRFPMIPVLLIAFGAILLLDNLNLLDIGAILQFWPAILILFGVYLLIGRFSGGRS